MSGNHTPASVDSTSSGSQSSYRRLDSNTTPSPSGGNKSPVFNPRALSSKLAMLQASQALAQASATLSIAAQAMSKAAASLAAVSDYSDEDYTLETGGPGDLKDWAASPDWAQISYNLGSTSINPTVKAMYAIDEGYKLTKPEDIKPVEENLGPLDQESSNRPDLHPDVHSLELAPHAEMQPPVPQVNSAQELPAASADPPPPVAPSSIINRVVPAKSETGAPSGGNTATGSKPNAKAGEPPSTTPASASASALVAKPTHAPVKGSLESSSSGAPSQTSGTKAKHNQNAKVPAETGCSSGPTRIILERGFDSLPALCHIVKRRTKTVCLYNYSGLTAVVSAGVMLRANTKLPVIVPDSIKQDKLAAAANKFNSAQSGVLLWPGCVTLLNIAGLANSPDIQLIQLGRPVQSGPSTKCLAITLILAKSDLAQPQELSAKDYSIDPLNEVCNQQGAKTPLQPFRLWMRSRLSDDSYARGFYWDWFLQHRRRNPKQNVIDAVKLANQYAEQFLLRGENKSHGEPVGGKVSLTEGTIKSHKLEAAVEMGIVIVA